MSTESSDRQTPGFTGALGENIVINELLWHGWAPANLNHHIRNAPNVDLLAAKLDKKVAIQIKTAGINSKSMIQLGYFEDGKGVFNTKPGPYAEFIVVVRLFGLRDYECYVVPVNVIEQAALKDATSWQQTPKRDGTMRKTFPVALWFEPNRNRPDESNYKEKWKMYRNAWHLLEAN